MKLILGLGNPGLRFRFSRHNLGFLVVEKLAKKNRIKINQRLFGCLCGEGVMEGQELLLAKPLSFVNLSGHALISILRHKDIRLEDLLIVCDDINLPLGKLRLRLRGSDGGHKGLRSITEALNTEEFSRLRIGVGKQQGELTRYVLGRFNKEEREIVDMTVEKAIEVCAAWVKEGIMSAMNRFN